MKEQASCALFARNADPHDAMPCMCGIEAAFCPRHGEYEPAHTTEAHGPACRCRGLDGCGGGRRILRKVVKSLAE